MFLESYFRQLQVTLVCIRGETRFHRSTNEIAYGKNRCGIEPMRLSSIHRQNREFINNQREYSFLSFHFDINSRKILSQVRSSTNSSLNNLTCSQLLQECNHFTMN